MARRICTASRPDVFRSRHALRKRFGYATYAIKKAKKARTVYAHVYCLGKANAIEYRGIQPEDDILFDYQPFDGRFSRANVLPFRNAVACEDLFVADDKLTGLMSDKDFVRDAGDFADDFIVRNDATYREGWNSSDR